MSNKKEFHSWDTWCLLKLKELGKSTMKEWAKSMGYINNFNMQRIVKNNSNKLKVTISSTSRLRFYEIKEDINLKEVKK